jgi:glutaminase
MTMSPRHPVGDAPDPIRDALADVVDRHRADRSGDVATYIPELATVDADGFGAALVSVHGRVHGAGDVDRPFTIQSVSKPFVYALAVSELGLDDVHRHVGFEPSGEPFNAISLQPETGRPDNPLINAGAIVTSALIDGPTVKARFERVRSFLSACAGRDLVVDEDVFISETSTGDRNRALAHLARSSGVLRQSVDDATEVYFRQCSLVVTTLDLAVMGATLANGGVNPVTKRQVMDERAATLALSIMATCGMYDHSGEWMARVGLPAKSGVGGGIVAVQPAQFGIGVYSPRLDDWGNSVRGSAVLHALSADFDLHVFDHPDEPRSPIVSWTTEGDVCAGVLRGEFDLISAEALIDSMLAGAASGIRTFQLDVTGVTRTRTVAGGLLRTIRQHLTDRGVVVTVEGNLD